MQEDLLLCKQILTQLLLLKLVAKLLGVLGKNVD